jgi:sarcosine oxidase
VSRALVVGAGVVGASVARELALRGWTVTLAEQYVPGSVRSASGGDTRLLRAAHGDADWYAALAWRARAQWLALQEEHGVHIWEPVGVAWFAHREGGFETRSRESLDRLGIAFDWLEPDDARRLYPSLVVDDLLGVLYEPHAGVLHARRATQLLVADGERRGVRLDPVRVRPDAEPAADLVVWACGPWLAELFPAEVDVTVERRDVFFFGAGADWRATPGFCDYDAAFYGHGEIEGLGVKVASDQGSEQVDPDTLDRTPSRERADEARAYAARRFPALGDAPVVGSRVCQYDLSRDTHFIVARHPERETWWLVGGGSGHGFKHGPSFAAYVVDCAEGRCEPEPFHALGPRTGDAGLRTAGAA